jgi:hypothetical protein
MSLPQIFALSAVEIVGDVAFKSFANHGGIAYLSIGVLAYTIMIGLLIVELQGSSILMVNNSWDAVNGIIESIFAFVVLGERFDDYSQYLGIVFIMLGMYLLKIPWKKDKPFQLPKIWA